MSKLKDRTDLDDTEEPEDTEDTPERKNTKNSNKEKNCDAKIRNPIMSNFFMKNFL